MTSRFEDRFRKVHQDELVNPLLFSGFTARTYRILTHNEDRIQLLKTLTRALWQQVHPDHYTGREQVEARQQKDKLAKDLSKLDSISFRDLDQQFSGFFDRQTSEQKAQIAYADPRTIQTRDLPKLSELIFPCKNNSFHTLPALRNLEINLFDWSAAQNIISDSMKTFSEQEEYRRKRAVNHYIKQHYSIPIEPFQSENAYSCLIDIFTEGSFYKSIVKITNLFVDALNQANITPQSIALEIDKKERDYVIFGDDERSLDIEQFKKACIIWNELVQLHLSDCDDRILVDEFKTSHKVALHNENKKAIRVARQNLSDKLSTLPPKKIIIDEHGYYKSNGTSRTLLAFIDIAGMPAYQDGKIDLISQLVKATFPNTLISHAANLDYINDLPTFTATEISLLLSNKLYINSMPEIVYRSYDLFNSPQTESRESVLCGLGTTAKGGQVQIFIEGQVLDVQNKC